MMNFEKMEANEIFSSLKGLCLQVCQVLAKGEGDDYHEHIRNEKLRLNGENANKQEGVDLAA